MAALLGHAAFDCVDHHTPVANLGLWAGGVGTSNGHSRDVRGGTHSGVIRHTP